MRVWRPHHTAFIIADSNAATDATIRVLVCIIYIRPHHQTFRAAATGAGMLDGPIQKPDIYYQLIVWALSSHLISISIKIM